MVNRSTFSILSAARVVALALIGLTVLALAVLRFASDADPLSVPDGAEEGDLTLAPCAYQTDSGLLDADCGILVVRENRSDPGSQLIALPVTRIPARSENPGEAIFRLNGGPGQSNMDFPQAHRYSQNHDVVMVGYRGIDGSVRLDCPEVEAALQRSSDFLGEESLRAYSKAFRSCANRLTGEGVDLPSYSLVQQADDLEAARVALGYERINLLSESAGTRTAMIYAWRYPESTHRSVMFGVNPPGNFPWGEEATDEQIRRYAVLCSQDPGCRARTDDLAASMNEIALPDRWLFLPIKTGNARVMSFTMMIQSTAEAGLGSASTVFDTWLSADEGDPSGLWVQAILADVMYPRLFVWGQYAAGASVDAEAARQYFFSGRPVQANNLGRAATSFAWGDGGILDAWPAAREAELYSRVRTSQVETLLIGGELDIATPPQVATEQLLPYLPKGHEVVLPGLGHSPSFWSDQPDAGTRLITTFFDTGRVDDSLYQPQGVDFTPAVRGTTLAKALLAILVALALLPVLSLLWMARRGRADRGFGPRASAVLRSVYPVVAGLGGLALGALIALGLLPSVHLDSPVLVVVAGGVPIGLGIYGAWVHRAWPGGVKTRGLVAATGGSLLGAWWGFSASTVPMALVTAIVGAIAGANFLLIMSDIARDRRTTRTQPSAPKSQIPAVQKSS